MTIDDPRGEDVHVVLGQDHLVAAAAFGPSSDDLFLSTFDTAATEIDLERVARVDVVATEGAADAVAHWCATAVERGVPLRLGVSLHRTEQPSTWLGELVDASRLRVRAVERTDDHLLLSMEPVADAGLRSGQRGDTLALLLAAAGDPCRSTTPSPAAPSSPRTPQPTTTKKRPRPQTLSFLDAARRWTTNRRRRTLALGSVAAVAIVLSAVGWFAPSLRPLTALGIPLLLVLVLLATVLPTYVVLLLARQVHRQTGRLEEMLRRDRALAQRRHQAILGRLDALAEQQARLAFIEQYIEAVAAHSSASNARMSEVLAGLARDGGETDTAR